MDDPYDCENWGDTDPEPQSPSAPFSTLKPIVFPSEEDPKRVMSAICELSVRW